MTVHYLEVRAVEMLTLHLNLPRMWKPRMWLAARLFWVVVWLSGARGEISVE